MQDNVLAFPLLDIRADRAHDRVKVTVLHGHQLALVLSASHLDSLVCEGLARVYSIMRQNRLGWVRLREGVGCLCATNNSNYLRAYEQKG